MRLAGVDLAWQADKNPSAIAIAAFKHNELHIEAIESSLVGLQCLQEYLLTIDKLQGIAIDAPLIINNETGQRDCERELATDYAARKAACHPSNLNLYPDAASVQLSHYLFNNGYQHLGKQQWQIECYPHPSIVECFSLPERLLYKKGSTENKRLGQIKYARLLKSLQTSMIIKIQWNKSFDCYLDESHIQSLKGQAIKTNEDALDSIMCVYIAALYQLNVSSKTYGNANDGYIWIPHVQCI